MGLVEVSLRASWEYPFIELSRAIPQTPIAMWCVWNRELLQVPTRDPAVIRRTENAIRKTGHMVDEWVDANAARVFLLKCTCEDYDSPWTLISDHECWDAPPIMYLDGWANMRVMAFGAENPRRLLSAFRKWGPTELVSKRTLALSVLPTSVYANALFENLTERQSNALLTASRFGYYTSPRPVTTEQIATSVGVSRTTYEEHLRKAENRVISAIIPYLQLFATAEHPPEELPLTGASRNLLGQRPRRGAG
ncbi:MAG TPA: helix-turn-helix domain-containing protein [Thermoplasmata archaeon]|nr:helix-turn-helix domain-containing protein [Thermoplasmata archaeon]